MKGFRVFRILRVYRMFIITKYNQSFGKDFSETKKKGIFMSFFAFSIIFSCFNEVCEMDSIALQLSSF